MLATIRNITKTYGAITVLKDISFVLNATNRIGVVGPNGVGKSTLLRLLMGLEETETGSVSFAPDIEVGYLPQQAPDFFGSSIQSLLFESIGNLHLLEEQMHSLEATMSEAESTEMATLLANYSIISTRFQDLGGYEIDYKIDRVLAGLHIDYLAREREVQTLSGGERARVGLATLLLRSPNVLLLDEPTNHLDFASVEWLENYLAMYQGALLMVSHDRQFLNRTVNQIFEIDEHEHHLKSYTGNYDTYVQVKTTERVKWEEEYERQQEEMQELRKRIKEAARNTGHSNRPQRDNDKFARHFFSQNVQSAVSSNLRAAEVQLERLQSEALPKPPALLRVNSHFSSDPLHSQEIITLTHLTKSFGTQILFQDISSTFGPGTRVLLTGPNGSGKTTLFKIIMQQELPDSGSIQLAPEARIGYLAQEPEQLDPEKTVIDTYRYQRVGYEGEFIGRLLGYGLFRLEDMRKKVKQLSQGQKRKLEIACLMAQKPNILLLDEPTNYISLDVLEAFEEAIGHFQGPVIAISHDRWFIERFGGEIWTLEQGQINRDTSNKQGYLRALWQEQT